MTPEQIRKVQENLAEVQRRRSDAGAVFYDRLFEIAPEVKPMFKGDRAEQERKLMKTLAVAVGALNDTPALTGVLLDLGRRHRGFGVRDEHYGPVGQALVWTLATVLGDDFDKEAEEAWTALYGSVRDVMTSAA